MEAIMDLREELVLFARLAWDRRLTESTGGNMSVRIGDHIVITPTTMVKHFLTEEDLVEVDLAGNKVRGRREASSEYRMHLKIYRECDEVVSVFHAHPVHATTMAVQQKEFPVNVLPETALMLAPITYLPYKMPGTDDFAEVFGEGLKQGSRTFVLRNHGVTVTGKSIEEAYAKLETLEFLAQITHLSGARPGHLEIPSEEVERFLRKVRGY